MGLPGAGKTTLAKELAPMLNAVWFNADEIRNNINTHLGFTEEDRIEQARRMGLLCEIVNRADHFAIADFVCPTPETRTAFNADFIVWVDRIKAGRFEDTNQLFVPPEKYDIKIAESGTSTYWAKKIINLIHKTNQD